MSSSDHCSNNDEKQRLREERKQRILSRGQQRLQTIANDSGSPENFQPVLNESASHKDKVPGDSPRVSEPRPITKELPRAHIPRPKLKEPHFVHALFLLLIAGLLYLRMGLFIAMVLIFLNSVSFAIFRNRSFRIFDFVQYFILYFTLWLILNQSFQV